MGRRNSIPDDISTAGKLYLERLKFVDYDYDAGGAYWGGGAEGNIYRASGETVTEQVEIFVSANDRAQAKEKVREIFSGAIFYR